MFCIKILGTVLTNFYKLFFGAGAGQSPNFLGGAGANVILPGAEKNILSRRHRKKAQLRDTDFTVELE